MFIWGTNHLELLNQMFKSDGETLQYDISVIESTEERLQKLCSENQKALNGVDIENINEFMEKFAKVEDLYFKKEETLWAVKRIEAIFEIGFRLFVLHSDLIK